MSQMSPLAERDLNAVLHPMSQMSALNDQGPMMVVRGEGIYLYDDQDKQYIDGLAGLWCTSLGNANEELAQVAYEQMREGDPASARAHLDSAMRRLKQRGSLFDQ